MKQFFQSFNNRETAVAIWVGLIMVLLIGSKGVRNSITGILKSFFAWKISVTVGSIVIYTVAMVYLLFRIHMWELSILKDTIFWFCGVGFMQLFKVTKAPDISYYKKLAIESIKITIILEFIANLYVFNLAVELPLVFIIIVFSMMKPMTEREAQYKDVKKVVSVVLTTISAITIIFSIYKTTVHYKEFFSPENLKAIALSPILTLCFLPLLYLIALASAYETFFVHLDFYSNDKKLVRKLKIATWRIARFNINKLNSISKNMNKYQVYNTDNLETYFVEIARNNYKTISPAES